VTEEGIALRTGEITARVLAERLEFLAAATAALTETLELEERLARLAAAGVPRIADCAVVHLREDDEVRLVAMFHADPDEHACLQRFTARWPVRLDAPTGIGAVIRQGQPLHVGEITDEQLVAATRDAAQLDELRRFHPSASLSLPLLGRDAPLGAVTFYTTHGRRFAEVDVTLASELVGRAGILIENAVLLEARERDREAQRYQAALLSALFRASVDGIIVVDPHGRVLSRNERFAEIWGFDPELAATHDDDALLAAAMERVVDPDAFITKVRGYYAEPVGPARDEVLLTDGRVLDRYGAPLHTEDGAYLGWAWTFRDVTAERQQQAQIAAAGERFAAVARTLQQSLLPPRLPAPDGIELAARYHPAFDGIEVGGDFYDVFMVDEGWCIVLGDVCGKGPEAARLTGLVRWSLRAAAIRTEDPALVLTELNAVMRSELDSDDHEARFATVCCLRLQAGRDGGLTVRIASAGHPAPLLLRADGSIDELSLAGTPVGLFDAVELAAVTVELALGEGLVLVTDGVLEARDEHGDELDTAGVRAAIAGAADRSAAGLSTAIEARALAQQGGVAHDDIAILVALVAPLPATGGAPRRG
jgi:phosphoserine phosphatase RsbU/P